MKLLKLIWFSFPVQLLVLHIRRHQFLLLPYVLLFLMVMGQFGSHYGLNFLYLDPEYLGKVSWLSFFFIGVFMGGFILAWNITSYILHSHRFPFLATFERPFLRFCINNSLLPLAFVVTYLFYFSSFQWQSEVKSLIEIVSYQIAFVGGMILVLALVFIRGLNTKHETNNTPGKVLPMPWPFSTKPWTILQKKIRVDVVFVQPWRIRNVRDVSHYDEEQLLTVFKRHHQNALLIEVGALILVTVLGFLMDYEVFRIPAAASMLLLFAIIISPIGAFAYYLGTWSTGVFILLIIFFNLLMQFDFVNHKNKAFGLSYKTPMKEYSLGNIDESANQKNFTEDSLLTIQMLENWKHKLNPQNSTTNKPVMVLINSSGGGLRASVWSFYVSQKLDEASGGSFYNQTVMISGASGGTLGQAYYRQLKLMEAEGDTVHSYLPCYRENIGKDLLNANSLATVVNDLLIPWQSFAVGENRYRKDRGYLWEKQLNENTGYVMKQKLGDYYDAELSAKIPMEVFTPTIIDDGRRLNIDALPVSYLCRPANNSNNDYRVDGIDVHHFFSDQQAGNLLFTTAIRMNATFPFVMPNVYLPTHPEVQVMDAGLRDNYGFETSNRFLFVFKKWIAENTSGVVLVQFRDSPKNYWPNISLHQTMISKLSDPINSIYSNWNDYQDFHFDNNMVQLSSWLQVPFTTVDFEYASSDAKRPASMSWHLTALEKSDVLHALQNETNQTAFKKLIALLQ